MTGARQRGGQTVEFVDAASPSLTNSLPVARTARPYSLASEGELGGRRFFGDMMLQLRHASVTSCYNFSLARGPEMMHHPALQRCVREGVVAAFALVSKGFFRLFPTARLAAGRVELARLPRACWPFGSSRVLCLTYRPLCGT
jgi:hypothetical protein